MPRAPGTQRPPKCELSPHKRARLCSGRTLGAPFQEIAAVYNEKISTVKSTVYRSQKRVSCISNPRSGRPHILTAYDKRHIIRTLNHNPKILQRVLQKQCCSHVSKRTLQRYLRTLNISKWKAKKRTLLQPEMAAARLHWAREHINWSIEDWKRVRWSDECTIERGSGKRAEWVFRRPEESLQRWAIQEKPMFQRYSQMFWACFGFGIRSDLVIMRGDISAPRGGVSARVYLSTLQEHLPTVLNNDSIFMQDNAGIHRANIIRSWFEEQGIELMEWPPYSPDLNPIENLWFLLKEIIYKNHPELMEMRGQGTLNCLIHAAMEAWEEIKEDIMDKLSITMKNRCEAVLAAEGWYTKY